MKNVYEENAKLKKKISELKEKLVEAEEKLAMVDNGKKVSAPMITLEERTGNWFGDVYTFTIVVDEEEYVMKNGKWEKIEKKNDNEDGLRE